MCFIQTYFRSEVVHFTTVIYTLFCRVCHLFEWGSWDSCRSKCDGRHSRSRSICCNEEASDTSCLQQCNLDSSFHSIPNSGLMDVLVQKKIMHQHLFSYYKTYNVDVYVSFMYCLVLYSFMYCLVLYSFMYCLVLYSLRQLPM